MLGVNVPTHPNVANSELKRLTRMSREGLGQKPSLHVSPNPSKWDTEESWLDVDEEGVEIWEA